MHRCNSFEVRSLIKIEQIRILQLQLWSTLLLPKAGLSACKSNPTWVTAFCEGKALGPLDILADNVSLAAVRARLALCAKPSLPFTIIVLTVVLDPNVFVEIFPFRTVEVSKAFSAILSTRICTDGGSFFFAAATVKETNAANASKEPITTPATDPLSSAFKLARGWIDPMGTHRPACDIKSSVFFSSSEIVLGVQSVRAITRTLKNKTSFFAWSRRLLSNRVMFQIPNGAGLAALTAVWASNALHNGGANKSLPTEPI
jgi:hypothetical protein